MSMCYPEVFKFSNEATRWGFQHEQLALETYLNGSQHQNVKVSKCGLFISIDYPFLGASPNGIVECSCCGKGICKVKVKISMRPLHLISCIPLQCPYGHRDKSIDVAMDDANFCLEKLPDGSGLKHITIR